MIFFVVYNYKEKTTHKINGRTMENFSLFYPSQRRSIEPGQPKFITSPRYIISMAINLVVTHEMRFEKIAWCLPLKRISSFKLVYFFYFFKISKSNLEIDIVPYGHEDPLMQLYFKHYSMGLEDQLWQFVKRTV